MTTATATDMTFDVRDARLADPIIAAAKAADRRVDRDNRETVGGALIMITHNTRILERLTVDRTHVMVKGHLVAEGPASLIDDIDKNGFERFESQAAGEGDAR